MTLNDIVALVRPQSITAANMLPEAGEEIDFRTPAGKVVEGAIVEGVEFFCGEWNVFVRYTFIGYDKRQHETTGWVPMSEVI